MKRSMGLAAMATYNTGLALADSLTAGGKQVFTFKDACEMLGKSHAATGNLLRRMLDAGLVDRVRHGHYAVRQLGLLGTPSVAQDTALAVAAAFARLPHRMAYRTALDQHDLLTHPSRTVQVACPQRLRVKALSGTPLTVVSEPAATIDLGAEECGASQVSDLERALLEAARRLDLAGGLAVLAEAMAAAGHKVRPDKLMRYAERLGWGSALRRLGSIADALPIAGLAGQLHPLKTPGSDLPLDPTATAYAWRDARWHLRWPMPINELKAITEQ